LKQGKGKRKRENEEPIIKTGTKEGDNNDGQESSSSIETVLERRGWRSLPRESQRSKIYMMSEAGERNKGRAGCWGDVLSTRENLSLQIEKKSKQRSVRKPERDWKNHTKGPTITVGESATKLCRENIKDNSTGKPEQQEKPV